MRHAVTLPESAISLQKESNSLQKGAGGRDAFKWGLVEMVLWSVRGWSRFSGFFSVQFCERGEEKYGGELTHWIPWQNDVDKYNYKFH